MRSVGRIRHRGAALAATVLFSIALSGCVAAVVPMVAALDVASIGALGFATYKTVQLSSGGSAQIEFPGTNGKTSPPPLLPNFRTAAIWPGDEGEVRFAERLQSSARFASVVAPAAVSAILAESKTPTDLKQLTEQEKAQAFDAVCKRAKVEFIFAAIRQGASANSNAMSFSRANVTYTSDLLGYSCPQHQIVSRDQIALVIDVGSSVGNASAMNQAGADAWADRVLQAMGASAVAPKA